MCGGDDGQDQLDTDLDLFGPGLLFRLFLIYKGAIQITRVAKGKKPAPDTDREHVTLPNFILQQLDSMVGPYAATRPEVIKWIVQTWLHDNREKVTQQVREYRDYKARTLSSKGEGNE